MEKTSCNTQLDPHSVATAEKLLSTRIAHPKPFRENIRHEHPMRGRVLDFFKKNQEPFKRLISKEDDKDESSNATLPIQSITPFTNLVSGPEGVSFVSNAEISELFEKMVSEVEILHYSGDSKTVFFLDGAQFSNSAFYGSQVQIEEFSTAPKIFNITFITNPQGAALFGAQVGSLMAYFNQKDLPFQIHRVEVDLIKKEDPLCISEERDNNDENKEDE